MPWPLCCSVHGRFWFKWPAALPRRLYLHTHASRRLTVGEQPSKQQANSKAHKLLLPVACLLWPSCLPARKQRRLTAATMPTTLHAACPCLQRRRQRRQIHGLHWLTLNLTRRRDRREDAEEVAGCGHARTSPMKDGICVSR